MSRRKLKVFIWNKEFQRDYTSGVCAVLARSEEEARTVAQAAVGEHSYGYSDLEAKPDEVEELDNPKVLVLESGGG